MISLIMAATILFPLSDSSEWITDSDYPEAAILSKSEGTVTVELDVANDGKPKLCVVTKPSSSELLNTTTCALLVQRARFNPFTPTIDAPAYEKYRKNVTWKIGAASLMSGAMSARRATNVISPTTNKISCNEVNFGDAVLEMGSFCELSQNTTAIEYFLGTSLKNVSSFNVQAYYEPFFEDSIIIRMNNDNFIHKVLLKGHFEINSSGIVQKCTVTSQVEAFGENDICAAFSKTSPDFEPDKNQKYPKKMKMVFEITADKRSEITDRNQAQQ